MAKLAFQATNNVAEYKAILMALCIIREVKAHDINLYCDTQLVVNQMPGNFQVRDQNFDRYKLCIQKMLAQIRAEGGEINILQIPREENQEADSLAKAVATGEQHFL